MALSTWLSLAAMVLAIVAIVGVLVWVRRLGRAEVRLARARDLLGSALAAELSAVKSGEIGAFDRAQRIEILAFIDGED